MIPATPIYKELLARASRTFKAKILLNGEEISGDIQTVDIYKGASPEMPTFGALYIPYFTAEIANLGTSIMGEDVTLDIGVRWNEMTSFLYRTIGKYHVTEITANAERSTIKAIGSAFYKISTKILTFEHGHPPSNLREVIDLIEEAADVTVVTDFSEDILADDWALLPMGRLSQLNGKTIQYVLGQIAGVLGAFVTEDYQGNIVIYQFGGGTTIDFGADVSIAPPTYDKEEYEITGVKCIVSEPGMSPLYPHGESYSSGDVNYTYTNKLMTQTMMDGLASRVIGMHYYPGYVPLALGNPLIDPWDVLSVTDISGTTRTVFPLQIHHHLDGGLSTDIDAEMPKTSGGQTGSVSGSIATLDEAVIAALGTKANDADVVHLAGDETITGEKTFTAPINGTASLAQAIPLAKVDSTSTDKAFTATVPGITELKDGTTVMLENGVKTSAAGFTLNINGLGAKPVFSNLTAATRDTTIFNVNYTMLFVYDSNRVVDNITGAWICYRGYDSNTNTIGYQLRTNSMALPMSDDMYRYRLMFTSADGTHYVPSNTSSSTNATALRAVNERPIDPFGEIVYYGATAMVDAEARPASAYLWRQYAIALGYSFNRAGAALNLTSWKAVYVKCTPQSDGSAIIDATTPFTQTLPSAEDGKIYIFLGVAYSATNIELLTEHPVYYYKNGSIRLWANCTADEIVAMTGDEIVAICQ